GAVETLLILGINPAYTAACDVPFADALRNLSNDKRGGDYAAFTAHLATHVDETSFACQWHLPRAHWLESWGDVRAFDGTTSIIQPLIAPMFGGRSDWELMEAALARPDPTGMEIIRDHWIATVGAGGFDSWWMKSLQAGVIENTASKRRDPPPLRDDVLATLNAGSSDGTEIIFRTDPNVWTGEFTNNAWLQELPKPFTKLTWDNAVIISPGLAQRLGSGGDGGMLRDGSVVRVEYRGQTLEAPIVLLPGQPDEVITLHLGYGRSRGGQVLMDEGKPRGFKAYSLRTSDAPWHSRGSVTIESTGGAAFLAITRGHHAMAIQPGMPGVKTSLKPEVIGAAGDSDDDLELRNRRIVRTATLDQFKTDPHVVEKLEPLSKKPLLSLYPGWDYEHGLQWGMSIDMTACIGCNACVIACQAENNIPVVGKGEVGRQREMHWIRIDDYFGGSLENPSVFHQPVPCMHCENAPCEYVCPVGATTHSDEGLNEMTYNRCVGTRYCSNNCPYKVRRFNFLLYSDYQTPELKMLHNPDVTVRSRGVMEKCTYCIQRIDRTRIEMEREVLDLQERAKKATTEEERIALLQQADQRGRQIINGLQTACQQSCPTVAIVFGDIRDPQADVSKLKKEPTDYSILAELTTKPRTTYLARISNPNPAMQAAEIAAGGASL
ncbi:MAG TPA: 4Fe-4S dicluster domain-containing protein, partial [Tepidisphaeraceae bacterium]|nr:4Fe-4S dicluster domain-containing protein [Tepidisphaeraceae bacterium]